MGWNPFKKSSWKKLGKGIAKGFKTVGNGIKKAGEWTAKTLIEKPVKFVADKAGDVAKGVGKGLTAVTGIKAFEKAGNKINNFTDNQLGPAMSRALSAPITALTGMPTAIMEQGLIDGIVHQGAELVQDVGGSAARLVGGEKFEKKFDKFYDEKAQKWIEIAAGTIGRVGLAVIPGGQIALAADAGSEVASLGYRAGNGEKLGVMDYVGAGLSVASAVPIGTIASSAAKGIGSAASKALPTAMTAGFKSAGASVSGAMQGAKSYAATMATNLGTKVGFSSATVQAGLQAGKTVAAESAEAAATQAAKGATAATLKSAAGSMTGQQMAKQIAQQSAVAVPVDIGMTMAMEKGMEMYYSNKAQFDSNVGHSAAGTLSSYGAASAPLPSPQFGAMPSNGSFSYSF